MRRLLALFFLLALASTPAPASTNKITKESLDSQNKKRSYYLYVPDSIKAATPAPLLLMLHGSGRNGLSLMEKWKDLADKEGIILAAPDAQDSSHWSLHDDNPDFLRDVVEAVKSKSTVNPRRVYLFGHSAGATFALYVSLLESQYFAATAIHAGALQKDDDVFFDKAKRKIPLAIYVGTKDPFFPLDAVRATRDMLVAHDFKAQLTEIPNHDHDYYVVAKDVNGGAWAFLKQYELSDEPYYKHYNFTN